MTGKIDPRRLILRLLLASVAAWIMLLAALAYRYIDGLTRPPCLPISAEPAGFDSVTLTGADGIALRGWWRAPRNGAVVLLLGGNGSSRDALLPEAYLLAERGFGVLTLEYRNCAGGRASLGDRETGDVLVMARYARSQPGVRRAGALGFSAGAAAIIRAAARDDGIAALVTEGNYYALDEEIRSRGAAPLSLAWQIEELTAITFQLVSGTHPSELRPGDDLVRVAPRPVLLIFGEREVDASRGQAQAVNAGAGAQLWVVPGAGHGEYRLLHPQEYESRVAEFFESTLLKD